MIKKYLIILLFLLGMISTPLIVAAQTNTTGNGNLGYKPLEPIPGLNTDANGTSLVTPGGLGIIVNAIFKILITAGALFAVLMLTIGGIQYMVSSSAGEKNTGIKRAQAALWGILLIAASYLILQTVNPKLLEFNLTPCPQGVSGISCNVAGSSAPTQATASVPCPSNTICANQDGNAAITRAQNILSNPMAASDPNNQAALQAGSAEVKQGQAQCTSQFNGAIVGNQGAQTPCLTDTAANNPYYTNDGKSYTACKDIQTSMGVQSCYYNP